MEEQEKTFITGFNHGYKLAKFQPDLVEKVKASLSENVEYERGLIEGIKEWEREKQKTRSDELNNLRESKGQEQDKDLSR